MRIVPLSVAVPWLPMSMLLLVVVTELPAEAPRAMLLLPVVLFCNAPPPIAVLLLPVVLEESAS